jgi:hypothetical protein
MGLGDARSRRGGERQGHMYFPCHALAARTRKAGPILARDLSRHEIEGNTERADEVRRDLKTGVHPAEKREAARRGLAHDDRVFVRQPRNQLFSTKSSRSGT